MKKIGEGYYYHVYDIGNGRVFKKQKSYFQIISYIFRVNKFLPNSFVESYKAISALKDIKNVYKKVVEKIKDKSKIGNPVFLEGINYEQDAVVTLDNILKEDTIENSKKYIDAYIELIKYFWRCGVHEQVFNLTVNSGITSDKLIMIDFNEVTFDFEVAKRSITRKTWLYKYSYYNLKGEVKKYYKKRMEEEMTIHNFSALWNKN